MSTVVLVMVDVNSAFPILVVKTVVTSRVDGLGDMILEVRLVLEVSPSPVGDGEEVGEPVEVVARVFVGIGDVESSVRKMDVTESDGDVVVVSSAVVTAEEGEGLELSLVEVVGCAVDGRGEFGLATELDVELPSSCLLARTTAPEPTLASLPLTQKTSSKDTTSIRRTDGRAIRSSARSWVAKLSSPPACCLVSGPRKRVSGEREREGTIGKPGERPFSWTRSEERDRST
jgi:hypothetical protein